MDDDLNMREWSVGHDPVLVPLFLNLERARKMAHTRACVIWNQHGLTPAEFDVLATLRNAKTPHELTPGQIQDRVLLTSGGLTKVIHLLEEKGYVERLVSREDNRIKPVRLTSAGNRCIGRTMRDLVRMTQEWLKPFLVQDEIQAANDVLRKMADS